MSVSGEVSGDGVVTVERHIAARPEIVFSFFTDRDKWLSWMGREGGFVFAPGGAYRTHVTGENVAEGRFVEVDPPKRLVFTWGWAEGGMPVPPGSTTVEITLQPTSDGTLLRLVHRGLPSPEACAAHEEGWKHYVQRLAVRAEGRDPGPDHWM
ncbi:SRPBCC domain-containing protein [Streptomyces sp. RLB3-17]|uniref:SRPBCC family protein n=1 Tax=unclassified Streptomyces TaxID=2593676 RepID=UPI001162FF19|nr:MULTISPECIES: SRPBCC domain-containing protein [unclassified Streptomyces]QDO01704.1 SRPBCC domain-containing protein [Streptomyces sp. RLB1-9]QDO23436.1 SRPBCC domain-containing protein [Streptomyces sp. S1A1-8]QDO33562.1 SRPBCC domain-containing protein [Streptomyces sp. S1A1-3]QDO43512.1 SRPBCC domain-containing protein [Streptomyces sp. RLB3-17]